MAQEKSSFIVRKKYRKQIELLNNEQAWMLIKAIMKLQDWEVLENTDPVVDMLISIMEEERRQDDEHYQKVCQKNKDNGSKGGRPIKNRTVISETEQNPTEPKKADNDNDIWIWYIKEIEDNKLSSKKKNIPSVSELVEAYESNELLKNKIRDTEVVKQRAEYKQKKKERAYKTTSWFIQQLAVAVKEVEHWMWRFDTASRLQFAVNQAEENERKWIVWSDRIEESYQTFKKFNEAQWTSKQ